MRRKQVAIVFLLVQGALLGTANSQSDESVFVGSRPLAMGGAFTAVADDANAMFYNPAGLQSLTRHQATLMNADLYSTGIQTLYGSYVMPLSHVQAIGVDWQHVGFGDDELGYNRELIKLAYSHRLHSRVAVGVGLKYMTTDMSLDNSSIGKGSGSGLDLGLLVQPIDGIRVGVNIQDVTGTDVRYDDGGSETLMPRSVRAGLAWQATHELLVAADVDRTLHLGGEYWFRNILALRMGAQKDLETSDPLELSFGIGLRYDFMETDLTHTPARQGLGETQHYGVTATFDPSPHLIKVVDGRPRNLYASYYKGYSTGSAGSLTLQNKDSKPLDCVIQAAISGLSEGVTETRVTLAPKTTQAVPFRAVLSEAIMLLEEDRPVDVQVRVEYETKRARKMIRRTFSSIAFRPGSLTWDAPGKAAAFVTHEDPVVEQFARGVYGQFPAEPPEGVPLNAYQAVLLYNALGEYGMRYVEDPENPFSSVSQNRQYVDRILYPREALQIRSGDCDDDVVLFCSLLENLNVATAFVEPPGHLFMMFDSGLTVMDEDHPLVRDGVDRFFDDQDGRLWIPVEVTLIGEPFRSAWDRGVEQMTHLRSQQRFGWISVRSAWQQFRPAMPPGEAYQPAVPPMSVLEDRVLADLQQLSREM